MKTDKIRSSFLEFFKTKSHKIISSDFLVSHDPTLLFTSAGMNQFKDQFMGKNLTYTRACSCQKCLRTGDLKNVGETPRHHTFFEMLGNFSFGDYFKEEAITWAWEYLTEVLKLAPKHLWVSVYQDDEEAFNVWKNKVGLPVHKIEKLNEKENFWPANVQKNGPNGPCGPCSEIFYDQGADVGCKKETCKPGCGCDRFVEIWNLVFTQYDRKKEGKLEPLPMKNIDTGMGLERIAAVMQDVKSNFEIDIFKPVVETLKTMSRESGGRIENNSSVYAIADHVKAVVFAIADGIAPSSDKRGYVVRKLITKALRHGKDIGLSPPFLSKLVPQIVNIMKKAYPELSKKEEEIFKIIESEELKDKNMKFKITNKKVKVKLSNTSISLKEPAIKIKKKGDKNILSGKDIFKLHDTYGIHIEEIDKFAKKNNFIVDKEEFRKYMHLQKQRSRQKSNIKDSIFSKSQYDLKDLPETDFVGYQKFEDKVKILNIIKESEFIKEAQEKDKVILILDKTPFYPESGGQVGDTGELISSDTNSEVKVFNTFKEENYIFHKCEVKKGKIKINDKLTGKVDYNRRMNIARNHTATHILHSVLREVLGSHVKQAGSLVAPDKLRFDFSHFSSTDSEQLKKIEILVNQKIMENIKLDSEIMEKHEATKKGALAFFEHKYDNNVRVINMSDFSKELCGGTHLDSTGQIGVFKIINESSVASGIRRIEAITGPKAYKNIRQEEDVLTKLCGILKTNQLELVDEIESKLNYINRLENKIKKIKRNKWQEQVQLLIDDSLEENGIKVIVHKLDNFDNDALGDFLDIIVKKCKTGIALVTAIHNNRAILALGVTKNLVNEGYHAGKLIKKVANLFGGGGGGKPYFAQAGGKKISEFDEKLKKSTEIILNYIRGKK